MIRTSDDSSVEPARTTRRRALGGAATLGLSLPLLAACGDGGRASTAPTSSPPEPASDVPTATTPEPSQPAEPRGVALVDDVPVGSGVVVTDSRVVVTQPTAGDFKCFSAVCPHEGCLVAGVTSTIVCACHNSSFDIATGEVLGGPSPAPLAPVDFTINENQVVLS